MKEKPPKKFTQRKSGEWVQPRMKSYFLQCCDCNLIHRLNFRVVIGNDGRAKVQFQAFRGRQGIWYQEVLRGGSGSE